MPACPDGAARSTAGRPAAVPHHQQDQQQPPASGGGSSSTRWQQLQRAPRTYAACAAAAAAGLNDRDTAGNRGGSASSSQHKLQQQLAASAVLERAAAAPRTADQRSEHSEASSSSSSSSRSSSSSVSRSRGVTGTSSGPSTVFDDVDVLLDAGDEAGADAAVAAAAAQQAAAMEAGEGALGRPPHCTAGSNGSSDTGGSSSGQAGLVPGAGGVGDSGGNIRTPQQQLLMQTITSECASVQQLGALLQARSRDFDVHHCAAAMYTLARMWQQQQHDAWQGGDTATQQQQQQQQQQVLRRAELHQAYHVHVQLAEVLLGGLQQQLASASMRDIADVLFALDKLGVSVAATADAAAGAAAAAAAASAGPAPGAYRAPIAALLQQAAVLARAQRCQLLQLSRVLTSCAHLGVRPSPDLWSAVLEAAAGGLEELRQHTSPQQQDADSDSGTSAASAQSVALLGWSVAKLGAPASGAWWSCYMAASAPLLPAMRSSQLSNCLWALASAGQACSAAWTRAFFAASRQRLAQASSQGLAVTMWGLAVLQQQPPQDWLVAHLEASAAQLPGASLQDMALTLWGLGRVCGASTSAPAQDGEAPPPAAAAAAAGSTATSTQQQQQQEPQDQGQRVPQLPQLQAWLDQAWVQLSRVPLDGGAPQGLACVLWGLVRLQVAVPQPRLQQLESMAQEVLADAPPQALAVIVWALGKLRGPAVTRKLLKRLWRVCSSQPELLQQLSPHGLCMLLQGLASMRAWQPEAFKQQLLAAVAANLVPLQHQHQHQHQHQQQGLGAAAAAGGGGGGGFTPASLPFVLVCLKQLRVPLPTDMLQAVEARLLPQLPSLTGGQLCLALLALGGARHTPGPAFLAAAAARLDTQLPACSGRDVGHAVYGLAAMAGWGGSQEVLAEQGGRLAGLLLQRAEEVLPSMTHASLAMLLWGLGRLQLRPPEPLLQAALTATLRQLPSASLLSITSILAALRRLEYLPPLSWMVEVCGAARARVNTDLSPTAWQRKDCVRRFEDSVVWYNEAVQRQQAAAAATAASGVRGPAGSSPPASPTSSHDDEAQDEDGAVGRHQQRHKARMSMLATASSGSEAMIAAAVGVAAAVAQQWHP